MLSSQQRTALSNAFLAYKSQVGDRTAQFARNYWDDLGTWRDADIARFLDAVVPRVQASRAAVANATAAYLAQVAEIDPTVVVDTSQLRGADVDEVYRRPAVETYTALSAGKSLTDAVEMGATRLVSIIKTDIQLAMQQQSAASTSASVSFKGGFRRTLTGNENCAKCYIASTQRYRRGDLLPIHPGCDCGIEPLAPGENIGQVLDPARLAQTQDWVKGFTGESDTGARFLGGASGGGNPAGEYADLIITRNHGEYGPTLAWRDQAFTGPADI